MTRPGDIQIKDAAILAGLMRHRFHPMLVEIVLWAAEEFGLVMTESFREKQHPNDLHGVDPVRAVDLRTWCYEEGLAERIRDEINTRWAYDPTRPQMTVAMIHDTGRGVHFHVQVHPRTKRRL